MESLGSADEFSESWKNCALDEHESKVKNLNDGQMENSMPSPKKVISNDAMITSSIRKEKLHSELVVCIERLSFVVKTEKDINVDVLNDYSSEEEDDGYLIEETQSEVNFSLKRRAKTEPTITESVEEKSLNTFKQSKCNGKAIREEHFIESEIIVQEELNIKNEDDRDQVIAKSVVDQVKKEHHRSNGTFSLNRISTNNRLFHLTEPPAFKCLNCTYQTHRKHHMVQHVLIHMEKTLKCSHCSYKTKTKEGLRQHELIHVPRKLVKLHQCSECSYTSIWKSNMIRHLIKHKKPDDITYHKCTLCCYKSSRKSHLTRHIERVHRPKDDIHCPKEGCSFKTHHGSYLAGHISAVHECKRFHKCSKCSYQSTRKENLKRHMLAHKSGSEIQWFRCSECPFKNKRNDSLKLHMLVHKSDSEIQWFRCSECPFKTKRSHTLKRHKLIHNLNPQKILVSEFFYCYLCTLRTPRKDSLSKHIQRRHRDTIGLITDRQYKMK